MASGSSSSIAKGGLALAITGGLLILLGMLLKIWGPQGTAITSANLMSTAQTTKYWYLFFIPIFGIICMALGGASYISEMRGTAISSAILGLAILLISVMFMFHMASATTTGSKDFGSLLKTGVQNIRIGWYLITFGAFLILIGGAFLSIAFKRPRMVKVREEPETYVLPAYQPQPQPTSSPQPAVAVTITIPQSETPRVPADEEEAEGPKEPPTPPEELLPPPKDDIPPPDEGAGDDEDEEEEEEPEEEPEEVPPPPPDTDLKIEKGYNHIILEESSKNAFVALKDLTWDETKGLILSTTFPSKLNKEYGLEKVEKIWLSHSSSNEFAAIDPKRLEFEITRALSNFMKDKGGIILIDGLEYLVVENGFENVLKFLKKIGDLSSVNNCTLIISVNPTSLSSDQLTVLKKDFDKVHDTTEKTVKDDDSIKKGAGQSEQKKTTKK